MRGQGWFTMGDNTESVPADTTMLHAAGKRSDTVEDG
jgi:hypothetical protein